MDSVAGITALLVSFIASGLLGFVLIPVLKKMHLNQTIKEIGPKWHQSKNGTPTMGGLLFIIGIILGGTIGFVILSFAMGQNLSQYRPEMTRILAGALLAVGFGLIGFIDDYIKVAKQRNLGLTFWQKTISQIIISACYLLTLQLSGVSSKILVFPFLGQLSLGWFYYPVMILVIYFMINAVNLTDGVDGLAASVTTVYAIGFMFVSAMLGCFFNHCFAAAIAGGCLGFLLWNFYPAKTFMGDTGSLFLGGCVVALAFGVDLPVLLLPLGIIYIIEALSVILQVISFQTTGKRIFKMSPIHHHFEMKGWSEIKIVVTFSSITALFAIIGILSVKFGL